MVTRVGVGIPGPGSALALVRGMLAVIEMQAMQATQALLAVHASLAGMASQGDA